MDAAMVIEQILEHVTSYLGSDPAKTRQLNFLKAPNKVQREESLGKCPYLISLSRQQHCPYASWVKQEKVCFLPLVIMLWIAIGKRGAD